MSIHDPTFTSREKELGKTDTFLRYSCCHYTSINWMVTRVLLCSFFRSSFLSIMSVVMGQRVILF